MKTILWLLGAGIVVLCVHASIFYTLTNFSGLSMSIALVVTVVMIAIVGAVAANRIFEDDTTPLILMATTTLLPVLIVAAIITWGGFEKFAADGWHDRSKTLAASCLSIATFYASAFAAPAATALGIGFTMLLAQVLIAAALPRERETESCS